MDASAIGPSGWYHLIFFGAFLPFAAVRSRLRLTSGTAIPSLKQHFRSGAITQLIFLAVAWLSGSLYVVMAVHVLYDITAGLSYGRLGRELGYDVGAIESRA